MREHVCKLKKVMRRIETLATEAGVVKPPASSPRFGSEYDLWLKASFDAAYTPALSAKADKTKKMAKTSSLARALTVR
eukprot:SAG22_NODE_248_length_13909_cov_141.345112_2_plen_78_part_00